MPSCPKRTSTIKFSSKDFAPAHSPVPGPTLTDLYEVDFDKDKIEEGSKSVVYKCYHKQTGSQRAVKVVEKSLWNEAENDKIRKEFSLLKLMEQPNI